MSSRTPEQKLETIRERVHRLLKHNEKARNSDGYLCWLYAKRYNDLELPYDTFKKLRSLDSVARARRYWQNSRGKFVPTDPNVREARMRKSEAMKAVFGAS